MKLLKFYYLAILDQSRCYNIIVAVETRLKHTKAE